MEGGENNNRGGWRERMIEELEVEYKVPIEWGKGPVQNEYRKVTDKCCLLIFIVYLLAMIGTSIVALQNSDHEDITKVYDSSGNPCGFEKAADYPILFM